LNVEEEKNGKEEEIWKEKNLEKGKKKKKKMAKLTGKPIMINNLKSFLKFLFFKTFFYKSNFIF